MSSAPQCINDRGHAAGILTHYEAQNRHRYYPFIWTPEDGMTLLPEPTTINDQQRTFTVRLYGARVLNLSNSGQILMRLDTDQGDMLVGWSTTTGYRLIRSEHGEIFDVLPCTPINLLSTNFILSFSDFYRCIGDGDYDDERMINCPDTATITYYPFDYNTMRFMRQGSYIISFANIFQGHGWTIFDGTFTAMSKSGNALVGSVRGWTRNGLLAHPFCIYRHPETQQWQGVILNPLSSAYGTATAVSANGLTVAGSRRRPDNRHLPFVWFLTDYGMSVIDIDLPLRQDFTPRSANVVKITSDGRMIVGTARQTDNNGSVVGRKAYQWTPSRGVEYIEEKYADYIPLGFRFPVVMDISSDGRYMLLKDEGSCVGYGVLDTQGEPMYPDNPTVIMQNRTAPSDAPDSRHAYPYVGDRIILAVLVKHNQRYYFDYPACGNILDFGRWYYPGHYYLGGGVEQPDFQFSHVRFNMPRIHQWSGPPLQFEWFRTVHKVDMETGLSPFMSGKFRVPNQYVQYIRYQGQLLEGQIYHRWYLYSLGEELPGGGWVRHITTQHFGTYRYYVRCPIYRNGVCQRWIGLHQPKPGAWHSPSQDDNVFEDCLYLVFHNSQNCDEADELAIRVSVRVIADWINDSQLRRKLVEWASSFVNVPYEWGGCWYGGRADNQVQFTGTKMRVKGTTRWINYPGSVGYHGYGIDCSGLVSAAARLAGYNSFQTSNWRRSARQLADNDVSYPFSIHLIQRGHLIVAPGEHVAIVYRVHNKRFNHNTNRWQIALDYIDACGGSQIVDIHNNITVEGEEGSGKILVAPPRYDWMLGAEIRALWE